MFIALSPSHPDPMYKQVTDQIKDAIASGDLEPNERLPSVRELAEALNVSAITIKRAYLDLETDGYILTRAGLGSFVAEVDRDEPGAASSTSSRRAAPALSAAARSSASPPTTMVRLARDRSREH